MKRFIMIRSYRLGWSLACGLWLSGMPLRAVAGDVIVVDNDNANNTAGVFSVLSGDAWEAAGLPEFVGQWGADYRWKNTDDTAGTVAWRPIIPEAGDYEVAVWYRSTGASRPDNARYTVTYAGGSAEVLVSQQVSGSTWVVLGTFPLAAGTSASVSLASNAQAGKTIVADAVRFRPAGPAGPTQCAGMRVSRIPFSPFPPPEFFIDTASCMTTKVADAAPCVIWIVSLYWSDGDIGLNFPNPTGQSYPHMNFSATDRNEAHLDAFDAAGTKVWLQVEPGDADVEDLIDIVLGKYGHHPCVIGFGVDGEWFNPTAVGNGRAMTDVEVQGWHTRVKAHDPTYRLFLKHYIQGKMPPTLRSDILFVDDSQGFSSLASMVGEFTSWANQLSPAEVGFQYGYPNDRPWWDTYADPAGEIAGALEAAIPNAAAFFWVDFTIEEIAPVGEPPAIAVHPAASAVPLGATGNFSVTTVDSGDLSYAWEREGVPLMEGGPYVGVATPNLAVTVADGGVIGAYRCAVTGGCGTTVSEAAALTLLAPGDFDGDGDVDHTDLLTFTFCLQGPTVVYAPGHLCVPGDTDGDKDVDLADFNLLQRTYQP